MAENQQQKSAETAHFLLSGVLENGPEHKKSPVSGASRKMFW
jgi:hypothetical protein